MSIFDGGKPVDLATVLAAKEARLALQSRLLASKPEACLVNYKCNIPGPVKTSPRIRTFFEDGLVNIQTVMTKQGFPILSEKQVYAVTGSEAFWLLSAPVEQIKKAMIDLEEAIPQGRLYDIDVLYQTSDGRILSLSRGDLGQEPRRCLLCDQSAKICGRSRAHSPEEMEQALEQLILKTDVSEV